MTSNSQNQISNQSRRTRSQRRRFRNTAQRIIDERRSLRQSLSSQKEQANASISQTHEELPVIQPVGKVQPQFTLTGDVIIQLTTAIANAVRNGMGDANPNQREQISNETYQEKEDESYVPLHDQKQATRESGQRGSDRNRGFTREDDGDSMQGRRYAWYGPHRTLKHRSERGHILEEDGLKQSIARLTPNQKQESQRR